MSLTTFFSSIDPGEQTVQILAAVMVLVAFTGAQFDWLSQHSKSYLLMNFFGSLILTYLAVTEDQWGFVLLEAVWAVVSLWGVIQAFRGKLPSGAS